jgi:hypothetical protein
VSFYAYLWYTPAPVFSYKEVKRVEKLEYCQLAITLTPDDRITIQAFACEGNDPNCISPVVIEQFDVFDNKSEPPEVRVRRACVRAEVGMIARGWTLEEWRSVEKASAVAVFSRAGARGAGT